MTRPLRRLGAARGAIARSDSGGDLLGVVEAAAGTVFGSYFDTDNDGRDDTPTPFGEARPFELADVPAFGDAEEVAATDRGSMYACDVISSECKGSVLREFPGQYLNSTLDDIQSDANDGVKEARKALKLLNDNRFKK